MGGQRVIVIGAGAAGLAAAETLARQGQPVTILEAQSRPGGRIHTVQTRAGFPVELGAEFIHGLNPAFWDIVNAANLPTQEVPNRHWQIEGGRLRENQGFWEKFEHMMRQVDLSAPDESFHQFLERVPGLDAATKAMALNYVEGFNAAAADKISLHALANVEKEANENAHRAFHITPGYSALITWLLAQCAANGAELHLNTIAKQIRWQPGSVELECMDPAGERSFPAERVLVTVPVGVLQKGGACGVSFEPPLPEKEAALAGLEMGDVAKIILEFRARFWPIENFGFIHAPEENLPTWWSDERALILVGWAGGPAAEHLLKQGADYILGKAVESLARIFQVSPQRVRDNLQSSHLHDWTHDPFSLGAYSYVRAGHIGAAQRLAAPVADTLFFAGEATAPNGGQGTVDSAIASGRRAAEECLRSLGEPAGMLKAS